MESKTVEIELWSPHAKQEEVVDSKARYKVVAAGRRFGKTVMTVNYLIEEALLKPEGLFFYIAPTYTQAKMIAWEMLARQLSKLPDGIVRKLNESELSVVFSNGSRVVLKGADNPDSLRGVGLDGVVLDEFGTMKPNVFEQIIKPTLVDRRGWAIFIGTPQGKNHFYELYERVVSGALDPAEWAAFHFTSFDNPTIPSEEIEKDRRTLSEDFFAQEYLAEFRRFVGLVYKDFDRDIHVVDDFEPKGNWSRYRAVDFGFHNPTAWLWISVDFDGNWWVSDELYVRETATEDIARNVKLKTPFPVSKTFGDPAGAQLIEDYKRFEISISSASHETGGEKVSWVEAGINRITERLAKSHKTGKPRLFVARRCVNLIKEFEAYSWDERESGNAPRMPRKENDHALDALRYFAISVRDGERLIAAAEAGRVREIRTRRLTVRQYE